MREKQIFGYVRVSAKDQNEVRQLDALAGFGIPKGNLYVEKQSGKDFDRPTYKRLLKRLQPADLLIIQSIDRLGRNYEEILEQWRIITKERQANIAVLDFPLLDTRARNSNEDLTGRFVADIVLQILAYVAQNERENIKQRQAEGIRAAQARGMVCGRPERDIPAFESIIARLNAGEITVTAAAKEAGMSRKGFYLRLKRWRNRQT